MFELQQIAARQIEGRRGKVFAFDKGVSMLPILNQHAQKKLERMRRYGSRKVKVTIRRNGWRMPVSALAAVRSAGRQYATGTEGCS
ncbi:hypothetical protein [Paraburkholderia fungorum]|uniref:hypothetical protein n=1 Tax=Paraburkholderia fungorum TaxID=134537 RepID=UPI00161AA389|nr:hypothetical protein [Paraburkholderia fungorum]MBB5547387.1 hypothetical protein [Paraburkholderia fungorum]